MRQSSSRDMARIAIFFAVMLVLEVVSRTIFNLIPILPIQPTIMFIPVVIAAVVYGPKIGGILGALMGITYIIEATILYDPTNSFLFSPFVQHGNVYSVLISMIPRILLGITPYYTYKLVHNSFGRYLAGAVGALTNTILVMTGLFLFFPNEFPGGFMAFITLVLGVNALAECLLSTIFTGVITERLEKMS